MHCETDLKHGSGELLEGTYLVLRLTLEEVSFKHDVFQGKTTYLNGTVSKVFLSTSTEIYINPFPAHLGQTSDHFLCNHVVKLVEEKKKKIIKEL